MPFIRVSRFSIAEFLNSFSILVSLGAFICSRFFAQMAQSEFGYHHSLILALSVWVVYTVDHILDGQKLKELSKANRHYVHYKYSKELTTICALLVVLILILSIVYLNVSWFIIGLSVAAVTSLHLLINHRLQTKKVSRVFLKEIVIALVVTIGFGVLPLLNGQNFSSKSINGLIIIASLFTLNLCNLLTFSRFDFRSDSLSSFMSIARVLGVRKTTNVIWVLLFQNVLLLSSLIYFDVLSLVEILTLVTMSSMLLVINVFPRTFAINERYRFWGDLIYCFPALALAFQG